MYKNSPTNDNYAREKQFADAKETAFTWSTSTTDCTWRLHIHTFCKTISLDWQFFFSLLSVLLFFPFWLADKYIRNYWAHFVCIQQQQQPAECVSFNMVLFFHFRRICKERRKWRIKLFWRKNEKENRQMFGNSFSATHDDQLCHPFES